MVLFRATMLLSVCVICYVAGAGPVASLFAIFMMQHTWRWWEYTPLNKGDR